MKLCHSSILNLRMGSHWNAPAESGFLYSWVALWFISLQGLCLCLGLWLDGCCGIVETLMALHQRRSWGTSAVLSTGWPATSAAKSAPTGANAETPRDIQCFCLSVLMWATGSKSHLSPLCFFNWWKTLSNVNSKKVKHTSFTDVSLLLSHGLDILYRYFCIFFKPIFNCDLYSVKQRSYVEFQ